MQTQVIAITPNFFRHLAAVPRRLPLVCAALVLFLAGCGQGKPDSAHAVVPAVSALPAAVLEVAPQRVPIAVEAVGQIE